METNSRKLLRMLQDNGWVVERIRGDHRNLKKEGVQELR